MCAACVGFKGPDAPPVPVLVAAIKRQVRRYRLAVWALRAFVAVCAVVVCWVMWAVFNGAPYLLVFAFIDLAMAWVALRFAEYGAGKLDHAVRHLRLTEALLDPEDS